MIHRLRKLPRWGQVIVGIVSLIGFAGLVFIGLTLYSQTQSNSPRYIREWFNDEDSRERLTTLREPCPGAPFILPSEGFIGLLWGDPSGPYNIFNRHSGIDVFGNGRPGQVPVYAVYDGYLTRFDNWLSTVIIRHDDPLNPGETIWTYYTHMADREGFASYVAPAFPPGTSEVFVEQGTFLGYQGEYSGESAFPVGLHVHMSIVESDDDGTFKSEAQIENTLDPSPYFGMDLNIHEIQPARPIQCRESE